MVVLRNAQADAEWNVTEHGVPLKKPRANNTDKCNSVFLLTRADGRQTQLRGNSGLVGTVGRKEDTDQKR